MRMYVQVATKAAARWVAQVVRPFSRDLERRGGSADDVFSQVVLELKANARLIDDPINGRLLVCALDGPGGDAVGSVFRLLAHHARRRAIDLVRRQERPEVAVSQIGVGEDGDSVLDVLPAPETETAPEQGAPEVPDGVSDLTWMHYAEGWTHERLARHFGITPVASRSRVYRDLRRLRRHYGCDGDDA